jgi:hypothetical protein
LSAFPAKQQEEEKISFIGNLLQSLGKARMKRLGKEIVGPTNSYTNNVTTLFASTLVCLH